MNRITLSALFLLFIFCTSSKGQTKTDLPTAVITSHGPTTSVRIIRQDKKGDLWLASNEGIIRYDGKSFTNITGEMNAGRFLYALADQKGNFWFGTYSAGVYYYDGKSLQHFTASEGLFSNQVNTIYEDKAGNIWFGCNGGVSQYDGRSFRNFNTEAVNVMAIFEDKTGRIWFGTRAILSFMMGKQLPFPPITATLLQMSGRSSKIAKAIPGLVAVLDFGVITAAHSAISQRPLSGISTKIKKETFGPVIPMTRVSLSFPGMIKGHCLIKS
jgi:ligand-binding sensor domain-containing protein